MRSSVSGCHDPAERLRQAWQQVRQARRVVVKIGSNLLTAGGKGLRQEWIAQRATEIVHLLQEGRQVVVVTSGAVAAGAPLLRLKHPPASLREKQAAAAAGQTILMRCYELAFAAHDTAVAQVLITRADVENRRRYLNARDTLWTLTSLGLVPVVNENDTVMVEEIKFGDNDTLSANVADLLGADLLILLSDVAGFFDADPRLNPQARPLPLVEQVTPALEKLAGGAGTTVGRGGMATKLKAAKMAARRGCHTVLTDGFRDNPITEVFKSGPVGTLFLADGTPLSAHKAWIANARLSRGEVLLDAGATRALQAGKSLLAKGVVAVRGRFDRGDAVVCLDPEGCPIAQGSVNYNADELQRIMGQHSTAFEAILGFVGDAEVVHRDNMVLLG
ncbi:MAG: glutamate 5-kinase [Magnetococcales bacterium]|nr:glutamate 5-kinase [Magnetococcales bacterium]